MTNYEFGDADLVIVPVTSKPRNLAGDISLISLTGTGLIRPSWMRLAKVATLLKTDVVRPFGRLATADRNQLAQHCRTPYQEFVT